MMQLIVINEEMTSQSRTEFLRNLEVVLMKNKLLKESQLKKFRKLAANDVLQILNKLSEITEKNLLRVY